MGDQDDNYGEPQEYVPPAGGVPGYFGPGQNPEFLKYLIDNADPIAELQNKLEGKEIVLTGDMPTLAQTRIPMINAALSNKIMSYLSTYSMKSFITTKFDKKEIGLMLLDVSQSTIDLLEISGIYKADSWKTDPAFNNNYPAFLEGSHQQILLMIEHTVQASLNRSEEALTLIKLTGMHTSVEQKTHDQSQKRGWRIPMLK